MYGLDLTLEGKPAVISGLTSCSDGSPGVAKQVGVVVGSTVISVGSFDTMAFGARGVGLVVKHSMQSNVPDALIVILLRRPSG